MAHQLPCENDLHSPLSQPLSLVCWGLASIEGRLVSRDAKRSASASQRFSEGMARIAARTSACVAGSPGLCFPVVLAGSLPRKLPPFQFFAGLIGLAAKPPPQLGQTLPSTLSTHAAQNVHSYEQIRA